MIDDVETAAPGEEACFEDALAELEAIVHELETGSLPLAEAIALYERGMGLARDCGALLDAAELQVEQVSVAAAGPAPRMTDLFADEEE